MTELHNLTNSHRKPQRTKRVGRGVGSKRGKTSTRGHKGDKSRSGYKRRQGKEGGQLPLYRKLPCRGFSSKRFRKEVFSINLSLIEELYEDGEKVNAETLIQKGFCKRRIKNGVKILSCGDLTKKVVIEASAISTNALKKLEEQKVEFSLV